MLQSEIQFTVQILKLLKANKTGHVISELHVLTQHLMIYYSINKNSTIFRIYHHNVMEINCNLAEGSYLKGHNDFKSDKNLKKYFLCIKKSTTLRCNTIQI